MHGILRVHGGEKVRPPQIALDSTVFVYGVPVWLNADGFLTTIATNERIYGYCMETFTAIATNSTGATLGISQSSDRTAVSYSPRVIEPDNVDFWMDCDQALTQTDIGQYMDVTISAGVVTGNLAAGSTGLFLVTGLLRNESYLGDGDTDRVVCRAAEKLDTLGA